MNSKLFKLCLSAILALSFNACGGDSNDDDNNGGGGNDKVKCNAGDVICNPAGTGLLVCNAAGNGYDNGDSCDLGCENDACKKDNGGSTTTVCEANKKECKNNQILTCKADGSGYLNDVDDCPYGCENGASECLTQKCTNGQTKCSSDGSSVETCNANGGWDPSKCDFGCDGGHCVEHTVLDPGSDCDPDEYFDTCGSDGKLNYCGPVGYNDDYTDYVYGVLELDCPANDAVCDIVDVVFEGENIRYGNCFTSEDECSTSGATSTTCSNEYDEENDEEYGLFTEAFCAPSLTTSKNYLVPLVQDECIMGACKDATACVDPLVPDQGEECDPDARAARCDGNVLSLCTVTSIYDLFMGTTHVYAGDCAEDDAVCDYGTVEGESIANCFTSADACTSVGATELRCDPDYGSIDTYKCVQLTNGKYWVLGSYEKCDHGCEVGATSCTTLSDLDGTACVSGTDKKKCDGKDVILSCGTDNKWVAYSCSNDIASGSECGDLNDGDGVYCYYACDTEGAGNYCEEYEGDWYSEDAVCTSNGAGQMYWVPDYDKEIECDDECDQETGMCSKLVDDQYDDCDDTFVERCDGEIVVYCNEGKVDALDCGSAAGYSCAATTVNGAKYTDCVSEANKCDAPSSTAEPFCATYSNGHDAYGTKTCYAWDDGNNYYIKKWTNFCNDGEYYTDCADETKCEE